MRGTGLLPEMLYLSNLQIPTAALRNTRRQVTNTGLAARVFCIMASPVPYAFSGASRLGRCACAPIALVAVALCGCSITLGSLSPTAEREEPPQLTSSSNIASLTETIKNNPNDPQAYNMRGSVLAQAGKTEDALADFNKAISLRPDNAEAYYNRGLLYQGEKQHQFAIDDFTTANGLSPQLAEPLLARALSYLALDKAKEAAADLDEAVQSDPQNAQIWITRGLAYERLGDKTKAAGSYGRAINLRPKDEAARSGFARVGGKPGQTYETF